MSGSALSSRTSVTSLFLRRVGGKFMFDGMQAKLGGLLVLGAHIGARCRIFADEDDCEPRAQSASCKRGDALLCFPRELSARCSRHQSASFRKRVSTRDRTASNSSFVNSRGTRIGLSTMTETFEKGNGMMNPSQVFMRKQHENFACIGVMGVAGQLCQRDCARPERIARSARAVRRNGDIVPALDQVDQFTQGARSPS